MRRTLGDFGGGPTAAGSSNSCSGSVWAFCNINGRSSPVEEGSVPGGKPVAAVATLTPVENVPDLSAASGSGER